MQHSELRCFMLRMNVYGVTEGNQNQISWAVEFSMGAIYIDVNILRYLSPLLM